MNEKRIRYGFRVLGLDRLVQQFCGFVWDEFDLESMVEEQNKRYGLKRISEREELYIRMEYSNIIWEYRVYYGSYKKRYKPLTENDERWEIIEKYIEEDLKVMGLQDLKREVMTSLKTKQYFEYQKVSNEQFKRYCV